MKIIDKKKPEYVEFSTLFYNDVFRPKNSDGIYIRVVSHDGLNAWGLTSESYTFFHGEEEVELLDAELHINS